MTGTAKEYAVALFELARENGTEADISRGLGLVKQVLEQTPDMTAFLLSPGISEKVKTETIEKAFGGSVPEYVCSFLCLLSSHNEAYMLEECISEYDKLFSEEKNLVHAVVTSVVELSEAEKQALALKLKKINNTKIEMEYRIDPSLIGGVVIEMDGVILDGSLGRRLKALKEVMDQ